MQKITIKAARVNAGLTQAEMGEKLGVSREIVNGWETGRMKIRPAYFLAICHITGFDAEDIFLPETITQSDRREE